MREKSFLPSKPTPSSSSFRRLDLLLLRFRRPLILATFPIIRVRHVLVAPAALVRRVVLLGHVGVGTGLEVLVQALVVFVGRAAVHAGGDDFFLGRVDVGVVEGGLDEGRGLRPVSMKDCRNRDAVQRLHRRASRCES